MKNLFVILIGVLLTSCAAAPQPEYFVKPVSDLSTALRSYDGLSVSIAELKILTAHRVGCSQERAVPEKDFVGLVDVIKVAFNDEFKNAGVYGDKVVITGEVEQLNTEFGTNTFVISTMTGAGQWKIGLKLRNSATGKVMKSSTEYHYKSGPGMFFSCDVTMENFSNAVRRLIENTVIDSDFKELVGIK